MSLLELRGLVVEAGERTLLDLPELTVEEGEILAVLGPTGAGKSTLLRVTGLLQRPTRGEVRWCGQPVAWPAPLELRRHITMAFQDPLLFSGSVLNNTLYGLAVRGLRGQAARERAFETLRALRVSDRAQQSAATLSGGEAQRVALARALVVRPRLVLLDEPLASLDEPIRLELREELAQIIRGSGVTCVVVTHDQSEACAIADRIAILDQGRLHQVGTPEEVLSRPADPFVARFVGTTNRLPGHVVTGQGEHVEVAVADAVLGACSALPAGAPVLVCIRPEEVELSRNGGVGRGEAATRLAGVVASVVTRPVGVTVRLECSFPLVVLLSRRAARELGPIAGEHLVASVPDRAVHLIRTADQPDPSRLPGALEPPPLVNRA